MICTPLPPAPRGQGNGRHIVTMTTAGTLRMILGNLGVMATAQGKSLHVDGVNLESPCFVMDSFTLHALELDLQGICMYLPRMKKRET